MVKSRLVAALLFAVLVVALPMQAATFVVPPDEWLIDDSPVIVSATVIDARSRQTDRGGIETVFRLAIDEVLKGAVDTAQLDLVQWGGFFAGRWSLMSGAPRYELGKRYVIFLTRNRNDEWTTQHLTLGRFEYVRAEGRDVLVRDAEEVNGWDIHGNQAAEFSRDADEFSRFIQARAAGHPIAAEYAPTNRLRPAPSSRPTIVVPNFAAYDFEDAAETGVSRWKDDPDSSVNFSISASPASANGMNVNDSEQRVIEEDPNGLLSVFNGSGTVATAFSAGGGDHLFEGKNYITITHTDIVTARGVAASNLSQSSFRTAMVHEFGHALGFRHSNQTADGQGSCSPPLPCATGGSNAVMNSQVGAIDGVLKTWDKDAVAAAYGSGGDASDFTLKFCANAGCTAFTAETGRRDGTSVSFRLACHPPVVSTQPQSKTISSGATTSLAVSASGPLLSYQWYQGTTNTDESTPVGTNSPTLSNLSPATTTGYWVKITNACATVKSNVATITVDAVSCTSPSINTQPASKSITVGNTTSLSVSAAGTASLTYQWYQGSVNTDESTPVGTNSSTLSNLSPASTTGYWVKITNSCGTVKSNVATITVNAVACTPPSISGQPSSKSISLGASASMSVGVSGTSPFTYQWFKGNSGDTSNPIPGATSRTPSITVTETTNVWVRVTGQCGSPADSNTATITVNPCLAVVVGTPKATGAGNNWTLSITASSGAPGSLTYEWYRGSNPGSETADKVGEGSSLPVTVTSLTRYWAKVTNSCGAFKVSELVAVAPCTLPTMVTEPADRTILKGASTTITVGEQPDTVAVQWYQGVAPDKTIALSTGVNLQVSPQETTSYWATLTNSCGEALSRTVIVTVDDSCVAPVVTTEPLDRAIVAGAATDLTVAFTGANVTVQWYRGASPDKTNPVGTGATVSSGPLVATTSYWALLTNACGEVSTRTVVVTVSGNCSAPVVTTQPVSAQSVNIGESATLSVIATGTPVLKYEWFEGVAGVTTKPVGTDSPVFTTPTLTAGTKYWVRISNGCGSTNSITAEVKVGNGRRRSARH